jgi:hypothetical protein
MTPTNEIDPLPIRNDNILMAHCDSPEENVKHFNDIYRIVRALKYRVAKLEGKKRTTKAKNKKKTRKAAGLVLLLILLFGSISQAQIPWRWGLQTNSDMFDRYMRDPQFPGSITLANGLEIDNATNNRLQITENSETLRLTFGTDSVTVASGSGVATFDFTTVVPTANQMLFTPQATPVGTTEGTVYYDSDVDILYVRNASTWVDLTAGSTGNTLDGAYDQGGAGVGRTIDADTGAVAITVSNTDNNVALIVTQSDSTNDPNALQVVMASNVATAAAIDIDGQSGAMDIDGTGSTWNVTGAGAGTLNSLTTTTTAAIGTNITVTGNTTLNGNTDIGNAVTDTLSITAYIDADVSLDDGSGAPPQLIFRDGSDETAAFNKTLTGALTLTTQADDGLNIAVGNLRVGNGTPGTAPMDGEDVYIEGQLEIDQQTTHDAVTVMNEWLDLNEELDIDMDNADETVTIDTSATDYTADSAIVTITTAGAATNNTYLLRLRHTTNADAQDHFLVLEDNAGDDKLAINSAGVTTWTMDATGVLNIDADTTANTDTGGVIDLDYQTATNNGVGMTLTVQQEEGATTAYGIQIDLNDDTSGGQETFYGLSFGNSAGTAATTVGITYANTLDDCVNAALGTGGQYLILDASTATNTNIAGLFDIGAILSEDNASVINIDVETEADVATEEVFGIFVQMDDDADQSDNEIHGIHVQGDGTNGNGLQHAILVQGANIDAGLYLETGYLRVGTGATPGQSLGGADNAFIEGTLEVDGAVYLDSGSINLPNNLYINAAEDGQLEFGDTDTEELILHFGLSANYVTLGSDTAVDTIDVNSLDTITGIQALQGEANQYINMDENSQIEFGDSDVEEIIFHFHTSNVLELGSDTAVDTIDFNSIDYLDDIQGLDSGSDAYMTWETNGNSQKIEYVNLCYISATEIRATAPGFGMLCVGLAGVDDLLSTEGYIDLSDGTDYVRFGFQIPSDFIDAGNAQDLQIEFDMHEQAGEDVDLEVRIFEYGNTTPIITDTIVITNGAGRAWNALQSLSTGIGADSDISADDTLYIEITQEGADHAEDVYIYGFRVTYETGIENTST